MIRDRRHACMTWLVVLGAPDLDGGMTTEATPPGETARSFEELLESVALDRDHMAFALLFAHFAPRLKGYLRRLGADDGLADDLVQDVMAIAWHRAHRFDPCQASVSTWLFTIARNRRIDALRRERRPELDFNDPVLIPDEEAPPEQTVSNGQEGAHLRSAIANLPVEQASLLHKAYFEDRSHSVIAAELGLPLGTVKSRIRLAVERLRGALRELR